MGWTRGGDRELVLYPKAYELLASVSGLSDEAASAVLGRGLDRDAVAVMRALGDPLGIGSRPPQSKAELLQTTILPRLRPA